MINEIADENPEGRDEFYKRFPRKPNYGERNNKIDPSMYRSDLPANQRLSAGRDYMKSQEPNKPTDSSYSEGGSENHHKIIDAVSKEMVNMLYGHLDDDAQRMHEEKAKAAMHEYAARVNKGKPFESVQDAVDALSLFGHHHYDLEGHDKHGLYANYDIAGDASERDDYEKLVDENNEIFNERLHDAAHERLNPKNESYSYGRRMNIILETIQRVVEKNQ